MLDIQQAALLAAEFVAGRTFADYQQTAMLRAAVERQCEITGEALAKLAKADEPVAARISDYRRIIAFRIDHEPLIQMIGYPAMVRRGNDLRIWAPNIRERAGTRRGAS